MYLWHYPIFAFARIKSDVPSQYDKFEWIILTMLLSVITYFFIEKFFRNKKTNFLKISLIFLITLSTIFVSSIIFYKSDTSFKITSAIKKNITEKRYFLKNDHHKFRKSFSPNNFTDTPKHIKKVLIVGNSIGEDFFKIFYLNKELFKEYDFELISLKVRDRNSNYQVRCLGQLIKENITKCEKYEFTKNILEQFERSEIVILSTLWSEEDILSLENLIPLLKSNNKKVVLVSQQMLMRAYTSYKFNPLDHYFHLNKKLPDEKNLEKIEKNVFAHLDKTLNKKLFDIAKKFSIKFLNFEEIQCDYQIKLCDLVTPKNYKIYWDTIHMTEEGAKYLSNKIYKINWFKID